MMRNRIGRKSQQNRGGVAAVELAITLPVLFALVFLLLEVARLIEVDATVTTAVIVGAREASIRTRDSGDVDAMVREFLKRARIEDVVITLDPKKLDENVAKVKLTVKVPLTKINGFIYTTYVEGTCVAKTVEVDR